MNRYTFPFNSCEIPEKNGISQPYSAIINIILCIIIFVYFIRSNNKYSQLFLFSVLLFNVFHTLSHSTHIDYNNLQFLLTHFSAIISTFFLFLLLQHITKKNIQSYYLYGIILLYIFDIFIIYNNVSHIYNIILFLIILFSIMIFYYIFLSHKIKKSITYIITFSLLVLFFQIFEIFNCQYILHNFKFPFHTITEIFACIPIILLCNTFYKI